MINKFRFLLKNKLVRSIEKYDINIEQLKEKVKEGAILIDIRSPQEYKEGHLEGSILIPEYELKARAKDRLQDKGQVIIVYCSTGIRSKKAQKILQKMGYSEVYNLKDGTESISWEWKSDKKFYKVENLIKF